MTVITDKPLSEKDNAELAILRERTRIDGDGQHSLIELEWQKRLMKVQKDFNEALMLKQHDLNKEVVKSQKRTALLAAILSAIFGIVGVLIGVLLTEYLIEHRPISLPQAQQYTGIKTEGTKPQKEPHETTTTKEFSSSKSPPKEKYK